MHFAKDEVISIIKSLLEEEGFNSSVSTSYLSSQVIQVDLPSNTDPYFSYSFWIPMSSFSDVEDENGVKVLFCEELFDSLLHDEDSSILLEELLRMHLAIKAVGFFEEIISIAIKLALKMASRCESGDFGEEGKKLLQRVEVLKEVYSRFI